MDFSMIAGAVSAANTTLDLVKSAVSTRDQAKIEAKTAELEVQLRQINQAALMSIQEALQAAQDMRAMDQKLSALENENRELKAQLERRKLYRLTDLGGGVKAYRFDPVEGSLDTAHYLCQPCMSNGKEIVLQPHGPRGNLICPTCKTVYLVNPSHRVGRAITDDDGSADLGPNGWMAR